MTPLTLHMSEDRTVLVDKVSQSPVLKQKHQKGKSDWLGTARTVLSPDDFSIQGNEMVNIPMGALRYKCKEA